MQGALTDTSPPALWLRLSGQAATGQLLMTGPHGEAVLRFVHGDLAAATAPTGVAGHGIRLGERLVHAGRVDRPDLDDALAVQADSAAPVALGHLLVDRGLVTADVVRVFLQEQLLEAVSEVVGWSGGRYRFEVTADSSTAVPVSVPVPRVLTEVRRRAEERALVRSRIPDPTAVPVPAHDHARQPRLSADAFTLLTAVDGLRSVGAIAASLGYAYQEASRVMFRLALQGLVTIADTSGSDRHIEDATLSTPTSSHAPTLVDDGWAERRGASATADEPEPWVGWANAGPAEAPAPDATTPSVGSAAPADNGSVPSTGAMPPQPPETRPRESGPAPPQPPPAWHSVDDATRQALFSELHAVSRADAPGAGADTPTSPPPEPPPGPPADPAPSGPDPAPPDETPTTAPSSRNEDLSNDEVSEMLRELHALNRDDPE